LGAGLWAPSLETADNRFHKLHMTLTTTTHDDPDTRQCTTKRTMMMHNDMYVNEDAKCDGDVM